jgi:putative hemolysin
MFLVLFSLISNNLNFNESILDYSEIVMRFRRNTDCNPASEFCIERGNVLEIRTDSNGGQEGIWHLRR